MRRLLIPLVLLLAIPALTAAQGSTLPPVFQTVTVGDLDYKIDPFYVVACFPIKTEQVLVANGIDGTATLQCFFRDEAGAMRPQPQFVTTVSGVMEHTDLGQPMYAVPQRSVIPGDSTPGEG